MDKRQFFYSELNDINSNKNYANNINKRNSLNINLFANYPKLNYKRNSFASRHSSAFEFKYSNNEIFKLPKFVHEKVKQYKLHPDRKPNLKIVNEDIKYRLFEMNEKKIILKKEKKEKLKK